MDHQIFIDKGKLITEVVPEQICRPGELLVKVAYSAFSSGTEFSEIQKSSESLLKRARRSPEKVGKALKMVKTAGLKNTINFVQDTQLSLQATGYSVSGFVKAVGDGITDIAVGDRVACSGAQFAHHATHIKVTRQLCVKLPENTPLDLASTVTLGAIAMQGVRQAKVMIGENVAVIGLGVIGQISSQILLAAGAKVTGFDLQLNKLDLACENGVQNVLDNSAADVVEKSLQLCDGHGFDKVLICSSDPSSSSAKLAFEIARHRGTVVMVGGIGLNLDRRLMYYKELNFKASMSYGPGRYERSYEEKGLDLPFAYVRWTENRNMTSYLDVVTNRSEQFHNLVGKFLDFDEATKFLNSDDTKSLTKPLIIIQYQQTPSKKSITAKANDFKSIPKSNRNSVKVGVIGVGGFAKNFTLPNLSKIQNCEISALCSSDNAALINMAKKYKVKEICSEIDKAVQCNIDALIIANRHSEHFNSIVKAVAAGKNVFVEKPTVNKIEDLYSLNKLLSASENQDCILYTGYNRAFSPHIKFVKQKLGKVNSPVVMCYQMNAGLLKKDNWQYDLEEGGRNIGEAVHIYHLFCSIFESKAKSIAVSSTGGNEIFKPYDNFNVSIKFENGCLGNLTYCSHGSDQFPKESFILHSGGMTIISENYNSTKVVGGDVLKTSISEKGHKEILESFVRANMTRNSEMTYEEQADALRIAFCVENAMRNQ